MNLRAEKEKQSYDEGLVHRENYDNILSHCHAYYYQYSQDLIKKHLLLGNNKKVLEIGTETWIERIHRNGITPQELTCINISETEMQKGISMAQECGATIDFRIMDANNLEFEDNSFDVVFGHAILHHLDFEKAMLEIKRVLKLNGIFVFSEPLRLNPLAHIVRALTPNARTEDELPLGFQELAITKKHFNTDFYYFEFFTVLCGVISKFLFKNPQNLLMKMAFVLDKTLLKLLPFIGPFYRNILLCGSKK